MEEGTANPKPSWQQSARASAAAEPGGLRRNAAIGQAFLSSSRNDAIRHLSNRQPLPFAQNNLANHVDYELYSSAHDTLATSGNHTYANPWATTQPQNLGFAPLVDRSPSQLAENIVPAGAAYNGRHYSWAPAVAAGPLVQYADTNFQVLDPSFSLTGPYAAGIIGNGHRGQLQTNGFNTHANAACVFPSAFNAVENANSYGGYFPACGFPTQLMAPNANPSAFRAIDSGNSYGGQHAANGFGAQVSAAGALPNAFGVSHDYAGQLTVNGLGTQAMSTAELSNAFSAIHDYGDQLTVNGLGTQAMTAAELPNAFDSVDSVNKYGGQFAANGLGTQAATAAGLPDTFDVVDDFATHVGPARHTCPECKRSFKRKGELKRHAKKHQADSNTFRCVVAGCEYSSYRKDKLDDHVKNRHAVTASASVST